MVAAAAGAKELGSNKIQVDFGPENILMNHDFLKAVRSGNTRLASALLESEERTSRGETQSIAIDVPINVAPDHEMGDDDMTREHRTSCLRGVTIGGNTSLHIVASNGDLELVQLICSRKSSLLVACNQMLETPLHCAARAGHDQIVRHMISSAGGVGGVGVETMLRARKKGGRTALHEAVQNRHLNVARELLSHDRGLAYMLDDDDVSPLYMAVLSGSLALVQEFKQHHLPPVGDSPFYAGPNGQTALHAAVLYSPSYLSKALARPKQIPTHLTNFKRLNSECFSDYEIAQELLQWGRKLARKTDNSGATPLHYAASDGNQEIAELLVEYDPSLAYIPDSSGFYPIHVAASMGKTEIIDKLILECPDSDELLDDRGRNFLHVAVEGRKWSTVSYFSKRLELSRLMNAADFEGNTPLHLLVENEKEYFVYSSEQGFKEPNFLKYVRDWLHKYLLDWPHKYPPTWLHKYWIQKGGLSSSYSLHCLRHDNQIENETEATKGGNLKSPAKSLMVCSILIATVTFAAAFTVPGGYKADGTPILAMRFGFKAFIITNALAFLLSVIATFWLAFANIAVARNEQQPHNNTSTSREFLLWTPHNLIAMSTRSMILAAILMLVAFAAAIYAVLSPIHTSIVFVCIPVLIAVIYIIPLGVEEAFN
ncbi:uncharacterized protein [Typha latifolia]|uniref:uncharacterized protein n=1 Tax=Typha latifolia TaxID=4733 RepID=UPI003C2FE1E8